MPESSINGIDIESLEQFISHGFLMFPLYLVSGSRSRLLSGKRGCRSLIDVVDPSIGTLSTAFRRTRVASRTTRLENLGKGKKNTDTKKDEGRLNCRFHDLRHTAVI